MDAHSFKEKVYKIVSRIPAGRVMTYQEVAVKAGNRKAARAVGNFMAQNKNWPRVPCHRVVRADGSIGNWSAPGGKTKKEKLLRFEGLKIKNGKILH